MESDGVRVEADSPAAAVRALKREKARREAASNLARERAYAIVGRLACSPGLAGSRTKMTDAQRDGRVSACAGENWTVRIETAEHGDAEVMLHGARPDAIHEFANGTTFLVETLDFYTKGSVVYAVGVADGIAELAQLPDIVVEAILASEVSR